MVNVPLVVILNTVPMPEGYGVLSAEQSCRRNCRQCPASGRPESSPLVPLKETSVVNVPLVVTLNTVPVKAATAA